MMPETALLRHAIATLAYRAAKMLRDASADFADVRACSNCRSSGEIVGHLGDLMEWALLTARGEEDWRVVQSRPWTQNVERFFASLKQLDECLASADRIACTPQRLLQGPIADALTHVGQLATLRRIAGAPVKGEDYSRADIVAGKVGADQTAPAYEFD
jgi:hypothetical protein